jgi:hypothetical protein
VIGGTWSTPGPTPAGFATTLAGNVARNPRLAAFSDTTDRDGLHRLTDAVGGLGRLPAVARDQFGHLGHEVGSFDWDRLARP